MRKAKNNTSTCAPIQVRIVNGLIFFWVETNSNPVALMRKQKMPAMIHTIYCGKNAFLLNDDNDWSMI
jgi:hypothetical protein